MHLLWTLFIGLIVGVIAKVITPGKDPGGFFVTIAIGIGGSLIATFLGRMVGWYQAGDGAGFIASIFGAVLLLFLYHKFLKPAA